MAVVKSTLTVTIAFPVWNDSCVNSTTIVLSSYCIFLLSSSFYLNFWTKCPKVAFMYIALKGTKKHLCYLT